MIDIRKLKELVRLMVENELTELDLRDSEEQVTMRRPHALAGTAMAPSTAQMMPAFHGGLGAPNAPIVGNGAAGTMDKPAAAIADEQLNLLKIESPMVGTFYATANPDSQPFVSVGTPVTPDKVVCIIEAMKIFNEIKAECTGIIDRVLVKSGEPVEFGQPLFAVRPG